MHAVRGRGRRLATRLGYGGAAGAGVLLAVVAFAHFAPLPDPYGAGAIPGTVVLDANGVVLQRDTAAGIRIPVTLEEVAPIAIAATIAGEDARFRDHPGVDPIAISRALLDDPLDPAGASTITQQLARRLYLDPGSPRLLRKAREGLLALQLDARYGKDEILERYLNEVYYGRGAYGIAAAARVYFGVSAANVDVAQAAYLAGLVQLPSAYDPGVDPAPAKARQRYVVDRLVAEGEVTAARAEDALGDPLALLPPLAPPIAPHFVAYALDELARVRPDLAGRDGLVIETTLDAHLTAEAERIVRLRLDDLAEQNAHNAAVVVIDPRDGAILTMVGNADFADTAHGGEFNMAIAPRQPGSTLKPFLYAAAFERGYTAADPLLDVPTTFETEAGPYTPLDFDRRFRGVVSLRVALASSLNVPAVRTLDAIGIDAFLEMAHRAGLSTLTAAEAYGLALTLGGGEVRLLDLTAAYGAIANAGALAQPFAITRVRDASGAVLYERQPSPPQAVLDPRHAYLLADILSDREARIPGFGEVTPLDAPFEAAVKTGTTTASRDNWAVGFTATRVVGVWVGNTSNAPMRNTTGVDGAGPIWRDVISEAVLGLPDAWVERPPGLVEVTVCAPTGLLPGPHCPSPARELFVAGTEPNDVEAYYVAGPGGELRINPPPEARSWAASAGLALASETGGGPDASVHIVEPAAGAVLYLAPELPEQSVVLRASAPPGSAGVEFRIDGETVGWGTSGDATAVWQLEPGEHELEVRARLAGGGLATATASFAVHSARGPGSP